ncbi:TauD/TfdA family dioxygenase [Streptomyces sp. NPDC054904]|uniref:TauD/TfdA family dioxygenase n=1 Tax=Streptomyces sp. NPDC090054 TaxID=3365933 RepID=UPI0038064F36
MLEGCFTEDSSDVHCRLREQLLSPEKKLAAPKIGFAAETAGFPDGITDRLGRDLLQHGLGIVHLDVPLTNEAFQELGSTLGTAIPETAPAVQPYVENGFVLNLRADAGKTPDVDLQPFAVNPLSLHSEGSGRAVTEQPRHIVLMCLEPGDASASTLLVPMSEVAAGLTDEDLRLLSSTRYAEAPGVPPVVRVHEGHTTFSFRDFQQEPLRWVCTAPGATESAVNGALGLLLARMYDARNASAVSWSRGLLVVIDNTRFFHGRAAGLPRAAARTRHLKRLRIR